MPLMLGCSSPGEQGALKSLMKINMYRYEDTPSSKVY